MITNENMSGYSARPGLFIEQQSLMKFSMDLFTNGSASKFAVHALATLAAPAQDC